jgi:tRNA nucleotidyltransferase (CCA-adding enzyme)
MRLFTDTDAFRRPERFGELLLACECDARGRAGLQSQPYPQADYLRQAHAAAVGATLDAAQREGLAGPQFGAALQQQRLQAVTAIHERFATAKGSAPEA